MHRELPQEAKIDGGTHMRLVRRTVYDDHRDEIQVELEYGTDDNGTFVPREKTPTEEVIIRDRQSFDDATADHPAPSQKGQPLNQNASDVLDFIDNNAKWPNTN